MDAAFINTHDCKIWLQWLKAKYDGVGRIPGRADFDQLLGDCQVKFTFEGCLFYLQFY